MIQTFLAILVAVVCALLLARLLLPEPRQRRFDAAARRGWAATLTGARAAQRRVVAPYRGWRSRKMARKVADEAINRARGRWDGNVYRPKSFRRDERNEKEE